MEIGWTELLVIGIVALIVIGPKDLPGMFRELGRFTAKMQKMGREFSRAMEAAAKETGVNEIASDLKGMTSARSLGLDAVKTAADKFEKWDPLKSAAKPTNPAAVGARTVTPAAAAQATDAGQATVAAEAAVVAAAPVMAAAPAAAAPVVAVGPETRALAEKVAARKAIAEEAAAKLRALDTPEPAAPEAAAAPAVKRGGRKRKAATPDAASGEQA